MFKSFKVKTVFLGIAFVWGPLVFATLKETQNRAYLMCNDAQGHSIYTGHIELSQYKVLDSLGFVVEGFKVEAKSNEPSTLHDSIEVRLMLHENLKKWRRETPCAEQKLEVRQAEKMVLVCGAGSKLQLSELEPLGLLPYGEHSLCEVRKF